MNQFLIENNIEMGSNDLYVIKKLREADITSDKIDSYLKKVFTSIMESQNTGLQNPLFIQVADVIDERGPMSTFQATQIIHHDHYGLTVDKEEPRQIRKDGQITSFESRMTAQDIKLE